jgi:hypothetical protein
MDNSSLTRWLGDANERPLYIQACILRTDSPTALHIDIARPPEIKKTGTI